MPPCLPVRCCSRCPVSPSHTIRRCTIRRRSPTIRTSWKPATRCPTNRPRRPPPRCQPAFADLDTDADGYIALDDIPAEFELSLQFEVADTDQDELLSFEEFEAYQTMPEEAELGE